MSTTDTQSSANAPTHIAYHIHQSRTQSYWTRIGAAWMHKDGKGFSLKLDSVPLNGRITLRTATDSK